MGQTSSTPAVRLVLTKTDASRLYETLSQQRDALNGLTNDTFAMTQRDFLSHMIDSLRSSMRATGMLDRDLTETKLKP